MAERTEEAAKEKGVTPSQVALSLVIQQRSRRTDHWGDEDRTR